MPYGAPDAPAEAVTRGGRDDVGRGGRAAASVGGENTASQRVSEVSRVSGSSSTQSRESNPYSIAGEACREERAYAARRHRRKLLLSMVRTVGVIVVAPVFVAAVFVASYALTCVLEGATPEELVQALGELWEQALRIVRQAAQFASGS